MTAPRAREQSDPPSPPDRRPPRRGGSPSSKTASTAGRPTGFARLVGARRSLIGSARALAALALLALSGGLALPATAQAQTSCSLNTGDIWCGLVTVAEFERDSTSGTLRGYYTEIGGNLRPDEFTDFTDGTSYSVSGIYYVTEAVTGSFAAGTLVLEGNPKIPNGLTFQLGGAEFSTTSATIIGSRLTWSSSGLNWSVGDVVTAKLTRATAVVVTIAADEGTVIENTGAAGFTLSRTGPTTATLTVTVEVTQEVDRDLLPDGAETERTVPFAVGSVTTALSVTLENDDLAEVIGELTVEVQAGMGYTVGDPGSATVDVTDVDSGRPTPANLMAEAGAGVGEVALSWDAYAPGLQFRRHQYRDKTDGNYAEWTDISNSGLNHSLGGDGSNLTGYTVTGLVGGQVHTFQVRTYNSSSSASDPSDEATATPRSAADTDTTAPTLISASVVRSGTTVFLYFSENFNLPQDEDLSATAQDAFSLTVDGMQQEIEGIKWLGTLGNSRLIASLPSSSTIYSGQTVVVSYDQSAAGTDAIADLAGNKVADFTTGSGGVHAVTNNSTATPTILPGTKVTLQLSHDRILEFPLPATVTATVSPASPVAFTVAISATPVAPATADDFTLSTNRVLRFAADATESTGTVTITPVDDDIPEPHDVVRVSGAVSNAAIPDPDDVTVEIINNDPEDYDVEVSAPPAVDEGAEAAVVTLTLTTQKNTAPEATVDMFFSVRGGTATRGDDYTPPPGRDFGITGIHFTSVQPSAFSPNAAGTAWVAEPSFTIGIIDDSLEEADETIVFAVKFSEVETPEHTITIRDNDATPTVNIAADHPTVVEEQPAAFTLTRTGATGSPLTLTVAVSEQADRDLLPDGAAAERTVRFGAGAATTALTVALENDRIAEPDGDLTVAVRAGAGYTPGDPSSATVTVEDGDTDTAPPTVTSVVVASTPQSGNTSYRWGETILFTVTFSEPVRVTGRPELEVGLDDPAGASGSTVQARFAGLSEAEQVTSDSRPAPVSRYVHFSYSVRPFDRDDDGVSLGANALRLASGARIQSDETGTYAEFAHAALGPQSGHRVDGRKTVDGEPVAPVAEAGIGLVDTDGNPLELLANGTHRLSVPEGGEARYGLRLKTRPAHKVVVSLHYHTYGGDSDLTVPRNFSIDGSLAPDEWDTKTVWVRVEAAQDDDAEDGERVFDNRAFSNDPNYHDLVLPDVVVVEADDDKESSSAGSVAEPLTASFEGLPSSHDGESAFSFRLAFSEAVAVTPEAMRTAVLDVAGGAVTGAARVGGASGVWAITVTPDSREELSITLAPAADCAADGAVCTADGRALSNGAAHIVSGPGSGTGPAPLTAAFEGLPESHDGEDAFRVRVTFSEEIGIGFRSMRDASFTVDGGEVTGARRVDGRHDLWEITVEPDSDEAMTITLPAGRACGVSGAICTRGENRRQLTNTPTATVAGPPVVPLTADFVQKPYEHDGETAFKLRIAFSEGIAISFRTFRDQSVSATGGRVTKAKRVDRRKDLWEITVEPDTNEAVTLTLAGGRVCGTPGAVCTGDGRALSAGISTTVLGPAALTVADARVDEAADAVLDFAVTLSRASSGTVAVAYATADGSATAGSDYTATAGTLTFASGETAKTVTVPVLDDAHDEGEETLTLRLSAATGAVIADGEATGTIKNTDTLQRAWLARFGRTAATHVTDAVGERLRGTPGQGSHLTVGGYRLPLGQRGATDGADDGVSGVERLVLALGQRLGLGTGTAPAGAGGVAGAGGWPDAPVATDPRLGQSRTLDVGNALNLRQVLLGSSFRLAFGRDDAGASSLRLTAWGRVAGTTFDGRDGTLSLDGDVLTGTVGVDGEWDRLLAGLAVAHSRGDGAFTKPGTDARGRGELETTLTSVHPYLRYAVNDRLDMWGVLGYGTGHMEMELDTGETRETDMALVMGAFGGRGILLPAGETGGFELATRTDAMLTRTSSDAVAGMASADAEAHRLRLVLEGSRGFAWPEGRRLTPTMEVGLRHDWGDAETGFGLELAAGCTTRTRRWA